MPLKVSDGVAAWIKDFKKSDAPQFKGKSPEERRDMALAAYLSAKRGDRQEMAEAVNPKTQKVKQLARLGLVDKGDVNKLMTAMKSIADDKPVPPKHRKIIFDAFGDLVDMITGDAQLFQKVRRGVKEEKDPNEYDNEGEMMKNQLRQICSANEKLMSMVKDDDNLPEWVQSKVTKATDYIRSVRDYLEAEKDD